MSLLASPLAVYADVQPFLVSALRTFLSSSLHAWKPVPPAARKTWLIVFACFPFFLHASAGRIGGQWVKADMRHGRYTSGLRRKKGDVGTHAV
jgi:hypothetical protein|tara:strand:- start:31037 stop:31315 length:279 start_codon:yes stop_codon:yes gene_type:complete